MTSKQKNNPNDKKIVIVGCGTYGRSLAMALAKSGNEVIIIDSNRTKLESLSQLSLNSDLLVGFLGDATIAADLVNIDIVNSDLFIATTSSDSINALAAQKAKLLFGINNVICLMSDKSKQSLYQKLGIRIVNHTELTIESLITSSVES